MLGSLLASPTVVRLGGEAYLVDRLRLGDYGLLLSEGCAALGRDHDAGDVPNWADEDFFDWLCGDGAPLFLWCVLRRHAPGLTLDRCAHIALVSDPAEVAAAYRAAMRRRRDLPERAGEKADIARHRWGRTVKLLRAVHTYPAIAELTLDQVDFEWTKADDADPAADAEGRAVLDDMQRQWQEMYGEKAGAPPEPPPVDVGPVPEGISADVARDVAALGLRFAGDDDAG